METPFVLDVLRDGLIFFKSAPSRRAFQGHFSKSDFRLMYYTSGRNPTTFLGGIAAVSSYTLANICSIQVLRLKYVLLHDRVLKSLYHYMLENHDVLKMVPGI